MKKILVLGEGIPEINDCNLGLYALRYMAHMQLYGNGVEYGEWHRTLLGDVSHLYVYDYVIVLSTHVRSAAVGSIAIVPPDASMHYMSSLQGLGADLLARTYLVSLEIEQPVEPDRFSKRVELRVHTLLEVVGELIATIRMEPNELALEGLSPIRNLAFLHEIRTVV